MGNTVQCTGVPALKKTLLMLFQDDRTALLEELSENQSKQRTLVAELEEYRECDPEVMEQMKSEITISKEAANRWTGRILTQTIRH